MRALLRAAVATALALTLALPLSAQQTGSITGRVTEAATGNPIPGAQIVLEGTRRGTLTNTEGRYVLLNVPEGTREVRVINLGYSSQSETVTVTAGEASEASFALEVSAVRLDALVVSAVTGQVERRRSLGTNVGNINVEDEIEMSSIQTISDVLQGRVAGLNLQDVAGTTGTSQRIRIRGANSLSLSNEPLIYIDGIRINTDQSLNMYTGGQDPSRLNDLNPQDIESIEILKGPAASALYGTAAANGVIVIRTKQGTPGRTQYQAYAEYGILEDETDYPSNWFSFQQNVEGAELTPENWLLEIFGLNRAFGLPTDPFEPISACPNESAARGICTQDGTGSFNPLLDPRTRPFVQGDRRKQGLSISGGTDQVTYYLSGDFEEENGVVSFNHLDKANLRANLQGTLSDNFSISVSTGYLSSTLELNQNDNDIFSPLINGLNGAPLFIPSDAFAEFAVGGIDFGDLDESGVDKDQINRWNHLFFVNMSDLEAYPLFQEVERFTSSVSANYDPLDWLTANLTMGLDYTTREDHQTLQRPDANTAGLDIGGDFSIGFRNSTRVGDWAYTGSGSLTGRFDVSEDLSATTTVGASYQQDRTENTECYGANLVQGLSTCGATTQSFFIDEDFFKVVTIGGFARQEFAWRDRVFLAGSIRGDDNSNFGEGANLIFYPSASLSWVIAEEDFFPPNEWLSDLRLRAAYGESGLRPGFRNALTLFAPTAVSINNEEFSGVTITNTGNPDLRAERSREFEFGFDAGLLQDRIGLEFTYYNKESQDALVARPLPPTLGFTNSVFENLGSVKNAGTELALNASVFDVRDAALNLRASWTTLDNEIEELGVGIEPIVFNRGNQQHKESFPAGSYHMPNISWDDANDDGLLSRDEVFVTTDSAVFQGESLPTWTASVSGDLRVFDWLRVSTLFDARGGNKQLDYTQLFRCQTGFALRTWWGGCRGVADPTAPLDEQAAHIANWFGGIPVDENGTPTGASRVQSTVGYLHDGDFVKWRELAVTLTAPESVRRHLPRVDALSLTVAGRNLATWTDYPGLDPEINETGGDSNFTQGEFNTQPPVRYWTARINVRF